MRKSLKKVVAVGCAAALMVSFAACGKKATEDESTTTTEATTSESTTAESTTSGDATTVAPVSGTGISNESSTAEIAAYYNEVMKVSKESKKVKGSDKLEIGDLQIGNLNSTMMNLLNSTIDKVMGSLFQHMEDKALPSFGSTEITLQADDIASFTVEDKGDTYVLTITPKAEKNPAHKNSGPQSRFFDVLEGVEDVVNSIDKNLVSFEGGVSESLILNYDGGKGVVTIDKATKQVVNATYVMIVNLDVKDVTAAKVIKFKTASGKITYTCEYK